VLVVLSRINKFFIVEDYNMADMNLVISGNIEALKTELAKIDLVPISKEQDVYQYREYLIKDAGIEHYQLLAYISLAYSGETIYDIGTHYGNSSLAMAHNPDANKPTNIDYRIGDFTKNPDVLNSPFIFIDVDPHDGIQEKAFHEYFLATGYKGLVMWDDINLVDMNPWWNSVTEPSVKKVDLTAVGHHSGTGLIIYS
jgi:hypothetical protein